MVRRLMPVSKTNGPSSCALFSEPLGCFPVIHRLQQDQALNAIKLVYYRWTYCKRKSWKGLFIIFGSLLDKASQERCIRDGFSESPNVIN